MNTEKRVLIAGFQHETNTFAPTKAGWAAFERGESFPPFLRGEAMIERHAGKNIPVGGFITTAREAGWTLVPSCWGGAVPSAHIERDAYEKIATFIVEDARAALADGLDAIYLDLHGAGVAEHVDDTEGELITRLRAVVGPALPIVASLDMHANVSQEMLDGADALVAYRTYPHVDMGITGKRAATLLARRFARGSREPMSFRRVPFLLPLNVQSTFMEPAAGIFDKLQAMDDSADVILSFATGFPAADIACCGPVVFGYGERAEETVAALFALIDQPRSQWQLDLHEPDAVVEMAMSIAGDAHKPVVIADTQDNPGAGGDTNTTGMLHALLAAKAGKRFPGKIAMGLMFDPAAAKAAHEAGVGAVIDIALGTAVPTFTGKPSDPPVKGAFLVKALGDGTPLPKGPMSRGNKLNLGPCACLEIEGVQIVVSSGKAQMNDREFYRHVGIQPEEMKILVNKSSVHFRADFTPIAEQILVGKAKGPVAADPADLTWTKLPESVALRPGGNANARTWER